MKKINRRDYLLQMGAGVAGVMGSAPLDILAESRPSSAPEQTSERGLLWRPTTSLPSNPRVTVIFGGLFGFFYNPDTGNCEIGNHKGDEKHKLMIAVWERPSPGACNLFRSTQNGSLRKPNHQVKIEIVGRPVPDVNCYQVGPYSLATRNQLVPRDFRWLPDLDSDDFYPENYTKAPGKFGIKSIVRHGTLYTYQLSNSTFSRVDPPTPPPNLPHRDVRDFHNVAQYMAAAIQPGGAEHVSLQIDNHPPLPLNKSGVTYQITILNHCYENEHTHTKCTFTPHDPVEENRNDFHHVRKVLQFPANETRRYGLKLKDRGSSSPTFCLERRDEKKENTDEAPCMGSAFGKTPGMP